MAHTVLIFGTPCIANFYFFIKCLNYRFEAPSDFRDKTSEEEHSLNVTEWKKIDLEI